MANTLKQISGQQRPRSVGPTMRMSIHLGLSPAVAAAILLIAGSCYADATGTGFVVSRSGYIITNYHVVADATGIRVITSDGRTFSNVAISRKDTTNDLVVLRVEDAGFAAAFPAESPLVLAESPARIGQDCFTLGFPLGAVLGTTARLSTGVVDSVFGLQDDPRLMQVSNPLQPGNSGGPLLNRAGELIGVVVSGLNARFFYERAGIIPQNVNFAIKVAYVRALVESLGQDFLSARRNVMGALQLEKQVAMVAPFVVSIEVKTTEMRPSSQAEPPPPMQSARPSPAATFVPPLRGEARVRYTRPVTKRQGDMVITHMTVMNASNAPILRLEIDQTWYDKAGRLVSGTSGVVNRLDPGGVATVTIETPFNASMSANNYSFTHANGTVRPVAVDKLP